MSTTDKLAPLIHKYTKVIPNVAICQQHLLNVFDSLQTAIIHNNPTTHETVCVTDKDMQQLCQLFRESLRQNAYLVAQKQALEQVQTLLQCKQIDIEQALTTLERTLDEKMKQFDNLPDAQKYDSDGYRQMHPHNKDEDLEIIGEIASYYCVFILIDF